VILSLLISTVSYAWLSYHFDVCTSYTATSLLSNRAPRSRDRRSPSNEKQPNPAPSFAPILRAILDIHLLTDWLTMHAYASITYTRRCATT
jgi:hypothetical protein